MLKITNVSKAYAKSAVKAVDSLTLSTRPGEIYGFLGPNGAGKTTTIKLITQILTMDTGDITIDGVNIRTDSTAAKRLVGFVPDNHSMYERLSGREYINFMADVFGVSVADRRARAGKLLELFNLTKDVDNHIRSYSHGMKQKICVIGALIHNPKLWILDEPLTGLDPQSSFELKKLMREHADAGNTVFFSTHVLEVAEKLCDRVGIIGKGRLLSSGTLAEIRERDSAGSLEEYFLSVTADTERA